MTLLTQYQKEALKFDKHISLTANAGSGKTTVLSKRFVEILLRTELRGKGIYDKCKYIHARHTPYSIADCQFDTKFSRSEFEAKTVIHADETKTNK